MDGQTNDSITFSCKSNTLSNYENFTAYADGDKYGTCQKPDNGDNNNISCTIGNLDPGTGYMIHLHGCNATTTDTIEDPTTTSASTPPPSSPSTSTWNASNVTKGYSVYEFTTPPGKDCSELANTTANTLPNAPNITSFEAVNDTSLKVTWEAPSDENGIQSYEAWVVESSSSSRSPKEQKNCTVDNETFSCTFGELESFEFYTVHLRSCNVSKDFAGPEESKLCSVEVMATNRTFHSALEIAEVVPKSSRKLLVTWHGTAPDPEDQIYAFASMNHSCDGTRSNNCTIDNLNASTDYKVCLAVCHPQPSSKWSQPGTLHLRDSSPTSSFFVEYTTNGLICAINSCKDARTKKAGVSPGTIAAAVNVPPSIIDPSPSLRVKENMREFEMAI